MTHPIRLWYSSLLSLLLCVTLAGCASGGATSNPNGSRYSISQDRAPSRSVSIADIPEVVPTPVNRTRAGNKSPYTVLGETYYVMPSEEGYREVGIASWYGEKFHGHKTSNGEVFDMYKASAAHKSLPIPSFLRVTNLDNNRSLVVRVNDRGPFHGDRIVDLSYAAALKLGYADRGTARVQLEAIVPSGPAIDRGQLASAPARTTLALGSSPQSYLQVGAFSRLESAREVSASVGRLTDRPVFIRTVTSSGKTLHRVRVGPINSDNEMRSLSSRIVAANLGSPYTVKE